MEGCGTFLSRETKHRPFSPPNSGTSGFLQKNRSGQENRGDGKKDSDDYQHYNEFLNHIELRCERRRSDGYKSEHVRSSPQPKFQTGHLQ
jgi:hypothetical protein